MSWMKKIKLIGIAASLAYLSGCASVRNLPSSCPQHPVYTKAEWQRIEQEVTNLPPDSPLIPVMQDYLDLLDKLEVCND